MVGLKKGTGGLDFDEESEEENVEEAGAEPEPESEASTEEAESSPSEQSPSEPSTETESEPGLGTEDEEAVETAPAAQAGDIDMDNLPYLVRRQMRGASVNADRTKQLLLEVRPFVKDGEEDFIDELRDRVDGPVYKGDAREAAMIVAQEHPELVAEKLREWGIEYLDK